MEESRKLYTEILNIITEKQQINSGTFCNLALINSLTWLPVEFHIKVTLRVVFHPHCDQSLSDLKSGKITKELSIKH